jgi:hypothetical protein
MAEEGEGEGEGGEEEEEEEESGKDGRRSSSHAINMQLPMLDRNSTRSASTNPTVATIVK